MFVIGATSVECADSLQEAGKKHIVLHEDPPDAVNAMLRFFYKGDYEAKDCTDAGLTELDLHLSVHVVADKYGAPALAHLAASKFKKSAKPDSVEFARVAALLWSSEDKPETLRSVVLRIIQSNKGLMKRDSKSELPQAIRGTPALAAELCFAMAECTSPKVYQCPRCDGVSPLVRICATYEQKYTCPGCGATSSGSCINSYDKTPRPSGEPWRKV